MLEAFREVDAAFPWFFSLGAAILGACVGSFLNVVIYRVPAGRSVVTPGSTCGCGQPIRWFDNIPVLSWFLLRGRARCCGAAFSFRYPAVELLTGFLFWAAWESHAPLPALAVMVAIGLMLAGAFIDLDTMEIPDGVTIGGFVVGVVLSALIPSLHAVDGGLPVVAGMRGLLVALVGGFVGTGLILWFLLIAEAILKKEAMGFGDVKLMGTIGVFFGWQGALFALFGGALLGTLVMLPVLLWQRLRGAEKGSESENETDPDESADGLRIPFGPALVAGALVYALIVREWVDAYFAEFAHVVFS